MSLSPGKKPYRANSKSRSNPCLETQIDAYENGLTPEDIRKNAEHRAYLTTFNTRLAGLEADRRHLLSSSTPQIGKKLYFLNS